MDYHTLLDLATDLGYELAMCGAETFRVEESINRVLATYGLNSEVFAIPNCLTVSIETAEGEILTRMRRIGSHGSDLDAVERFNGLSRAICNRKPDPQEGKRWLEMVRNSRIYYTCPPRQPNDHRRVCGLADQREVVPLSQKAKTGKEVNFAALKKTPFVHRTKGAFYVGRSLRDFRNMLYYRQR